MKSRLIVLGGALSVALVLAAMHLLSLMPLVSGMGAKAMCSCFWVGERTREDVLSKEMNVFPLVLGTFKIDKRDSSATGDVFGLFKRKAIYRQQLGCTLLSGDLEIDLKEKSTLTRPRIPDSLRNLPWPQGESSEIITPSGVDVVRLTKIIENVFSKRVELNIRSLIVVYDGQLIVEKYGNGFSATSKQTGWSMSKSILNGLVGVAVNENLINVTEHSLINEWRDERSDITVGNLMQQNSGLSWDESYSGRSEVTRMLFEEGDMAEFASKRPLKETPGKIFNYSSGNAMILSKILAEKIGPENYLNFIYEKFFHKIGMYNTVVETDNANNFVASSYTFATARDWARFGLLYCNNGDWFGQQIFPPGWVEYSTRPAKSAPNGEYGALFWLNHGNETIPEQINGIVPEVPKDTFWAEGFDGQRIFIIPSKKLVIVRLAMTRGNTLNDKEFLNEVVSCIPD